MIEKTSCFADHMARRTIVAAFAACDAFAAFAAFVAFVVGETFVLVAPGLIFRFSEDELLDAEWMFFPMHWSHLSAST